MDILIFLVIIIGSAVISANKKSNNSNKTTSPKTVNTSGKKNNNQKNYNYKKKNIKSKKNTNKNIENPIVKSTTDLELNQNTFGEIILKEDDNRIETEYINGIGEEIRKNPKKAFVMSEIFNRKY